MANQTAPKKNLKKGDTVKIIGRRWFQRTYGNTYHSCAVYVNGELIGREPFAYGYDNAYEQTAKEILEKQYNIGLDKNQSLWRLRDMKGITYINLVVDVNRKKDL